MKQFVKGWVVQFCIDGDWQTDRISGSWARFDTRVLSRALARARMGQLRQMHRAFGHGDVIQKYRIRRATVTLEIEA